jgi:hypothetical protein
MSIMVRAALTSKEWTALRKLSLDKGVTTSELIARALRASRVTAQTLKDAA